MLGQVKASFDPHYGSHPWVSPLFDPRRNLAISRDAVGGFPSASAVENQSAMWETWVQSLGQEDPLEEGMATHSNILTWRIPWTEEPGMLQSTGLERVGHDLSV